VGDVPLLVELGVDPDRLDPVDDDGGDHRLVRVAGDQQLLAGAGHGQHGGLDRQGAAARGEERLLGADRVRHQLLGLAQHALGLAAVVEPVEGQDVRAEHVEADDLGHTSVDASALLVTGRPEDDVSAAPELLQRLQHGHP
jgi:hypothetical protein